MPGRHQPAGVFFVAAVKSVKSPVALLQLKGATQQQFNQGRNGRNKKPKTVPGCTIKTIRSKTLLYIRQLAI